MMKPKTADTMKHRTTLEIELTPTGYRWTVLVDRSVIVASGTAPTEFQAALAGSQALLDTTKPIALEP